MARPASENRIPKHATRDRLSAPEGGRKFECPAPIVFLTRVTRFALARSRKIALALLDVSFEITLEHPNGFFVHLDSGDHQVFRLRVTLITGKITGGLHVRK